jgi:phage/plasmid-like protein (TIGR03299 family)
MVHATVSVPTISADPLAALRSWEPLAVVPFYPFPGTDATARAEGFRLIVRSDNGAPLGAVRAGYAGVSHADLCTLADRLADSGAVADLRAFQFGGGRRVGIQGRVTGRTLEIVPGQPVEQRFTLLDAHDGSAALAVVDSAVNIVCWNTWQTAHRTGRGARMRHTRSIAARFDAVRAHLERSAVAWQESAEAWRSLVARPMAWADFRALILDRIAPMPPAKDCEANWRARSNAQRARDALSWAWESAPGAQPGTRYGAWQAVTYYATHRAGRTAATRDESNLRGPLATMARESLRLLLAAGGAN